MGLRRVILRILGCLGIPFPSNFVRILLRLIRNLLQHLLRIQRAPRSRPTVTVQSLSLNNLGIDHFNVFIGITPVTEWRVLHDFGRIPSGIRASPERGPSLGLGISNPDVGPQSTISLRVGTRHRARAPGRPRVCPHRVVSSQTPGGDLQLCFLETAVFLFLSPPFVTVVGYSFGEAHIN